ncbi:MAG: PilN domain-containing protein [Candidatus Aerophobetes bacterium]|nr:PilN domain-containing protein [Candidatus Aerophobetes bacterium]
MIEINLLPKRTLKRKGVKAFVIFVSISAVAIGLICLSLFSSVKEEVKIAERQLSLVKSEVKKYEPLLGELEELKAEEAEILLRLNNLKRLVISRPSWAQVLYVISGSLPKNIWLTELIQTPENEERVITIQGYGLNQTVDIAKFMENLNNSSIFNRINLSEISRRVINATKVMEFKLNCSLKSLGKEG